MNIFGKIGLMVLLLVTVFAGRLFASSTITYWPDNKEGAVSLTFDDGCPSQYSLAIPALNERGVKSTFFLITDDYPTSADWDLSRAVSDMGHEIGSHSKTHPYLTSLSLARMQDEINGSKAVIDAQITSQRCISFAYPFGDLNNDVQSIAQNTYSAARGISCGLNSAPYDFSNIKACSPEYGAYDIYAQANEAEQQKKWLVVYLHSLVGGSDCYGDWDLNNLTDYLDYLKTKDLWVGTFGAIVKYIKERDSATLSIVSSSINRTVLSLTDTKDDSIYDEPLTIRSEVPSDWAYATVQQGSNINTLESEWDGAARLIYFKAVPDRGLITLDNATSCTETGFLSISQGQMLSGDLLNLTSIVTAYNAANLVYRVREGDGCPAQVNKSIVARQDTWKYDIENTGNIWMNIGYDDLNWATGRGIFGTEPNLIITTPISNTYSSIFFRKTFTVCDPSAVTALTLSALFDDGLVVYINGTKVYSEGVAGDPPQYNGGATGHEAVRYEVKDLSSAIGIDALRQLLVPGENIIAVGVYNAIDFINIPPSISSDIVWDGELVISHNKTDGILFTGNATQSQSVDTTGWTDGEKALDVTGDDAACGTALMPVSDTFLFERALSSHVLFKEDFESGRLGRQWRARSTRYGRTRVTTNNGPCGGRYHLTMDDSRSRGNYSLNELILTIDLAGKKGVKLKFNHKEFSDEDHMMPAVFKGSNKSDGVAVSADGLTWYRVQGLTSVDGISTACTNFTVDLDAAVAAAGIGYTSAFKIKFQQYDDSPISSDGFAFDDIELASQYSDGQ